MRDDDNPLSDIDLAAWDPPPPPAGIADAVVERMREAVAASPMTHLIQTSRSRRRWWIAGAATAAVAAVVIIVVGSRRDPTGHGSVAAERAQHLDLGDVGGDLDPGVDLRWERDANGVRIDQRRGVALWKVTDDEHLVIDTGAAGASVEASGASLRVEVQMNQSDARLIGVSGATAAAVALVTVIVYEGHVKVSNGGQVTNLAPGATLQIAPKEAPVVGANAPDPRVPHADVLIECLQAKADKNWQALEDCSKKLARVDPEKAKAYRELAMSEQKAWFSYEKLEQAVAAGSLKDARLQLDAVAETSVYRAAAKASYDQAENAVKDRMGKQVDDLLAHHKCAELKTLVTQVSKAYGEAVADDVRASASRCDWPVTPGCDAEALRQKGVDRVNRGQYAAGLEQLDHALACKPGDQALVRIAYVAACNAKNAPRARQLFAEMPADKRQPLAQVCVRNKIDPTKKVGADPDQPACDPDAFRSKGTEYVNMGQFGAGLAEFKKAMACKGGTTLAVIRLAYMAACQAGEATTAKQLFAQIPPNQQGNLAEICRRNKIEPTTLDADPASTTNAPKVDCDPDALRSKATEFVNMGQYGAGLEQFKKAMACKGGNTLAVIRLGYMAACAAGDATSAKQLFARIPPDQQGNLAQICLRNKIDPSRP